MATVQASQSRAALCASVSTPIARPLEAFVNQKIHAGEPLWGNYPPGDEVKAEYKKWRESTAVSERSGAVERPGLADPQTEES